MSKRATDWKDRRDGNLLKLIGLFVPLRGSANDEGIGMDISQHGEEAYLHAEGWGKG
jgi:hypothetical protein